MSDFISMISLVKKPTNRSMKRDIKYEVENIVERIHQLESEFWEDVCRNCDEEDFDHNALVEKYNFKFLHLVNWLNRNIKPKFVAINKDYFSMYYGVQGRK